MPEEVSFYIRAKDLTKRGIDGAVRQLTRLQRVGKRAAAVIGKALKWGLGAAATAASAAVVGLGLALRKSFEFERYRTQFAVLFGDMDKAKKHFDELKSFAGSTPFQLADVAVASRQLHVFSEGAMGGTRSLRLVGDAAAAVGQPIAEVAMWIGRAYAAIKGGRPFGEAAQRLGEMAILAPSARAKMEELQKAGASSAEVFSVLMDELKKNAGGMETLSKTGEGLVSTLKDNLDQTLAAIGDKFSELAKDHIAGATDALKKFQEQDLDEWADTTIGALERVGAALDATKAVMQFGGGAIGGFMSGFGESVKKRGIMGALLNPMGTGWDTFKGTLAGIEDEAERQQERKRQKAIGPGGILGKGSATAKAEAAAAAGAETDASILAGLSTSDDSGWLGKNMAYHAKQAAGGQKVGPTKANAAPILRQKRKRAAAEARRARIQQYMSRRQELAGLMGGGAQQQGPWAQQVGLGEAFTKAYGQDKAQDPNETTASNTTEMVKLLREMKRLRAGGMVK